MAATRRAYTGAAVSTTTASAIAASGTTSFTITAYTGWPYGSDPFFVVVEPGTASEEKILVTRTGSTDTTINIASDSERAQDGTSAVAHSSGSIVFPVFTSVDADEANAVASIITADTTNSRIGIGTATPSRKIHVDSGSAAVTAQFTSQHASLGLIEFEDSASTATGQFGLDGDDFVFRPLQTERMRIDASGNVGINDTSPSYALDVTGDINATGDLRIGGTAIGTWQTYTPTFAASGGGAAIGNGTIVGKYCQVNNLVFVENIITFGSTSTFGTTRFLISTPVTLAAPLAAFTVINGSGAAYDVSSPQNAYTLVVSHYSPPGSYVMLRVTAPAYGEVKYNQPFTFGNGDVIQFGYVTEAA